MNVSNGALWGGSWTRHFCVAAIVAALAYSLLSIANYGSGSSDAAIEARRKPQSAKPAHAQAALPVSAHQLSKAVAASPDLCQVMEAAGAPGFNGGRLRVFHRLREQTSAAAWVRQRRCSFRSFQASLSDYRDLVLGLSAGPVTAADFAKFANSTPANPARQFWTEGELGQSGYGWMRKAARELELHYHLNDGRHLTVRWSGSGTNPADDIFALRDFARRATEQIEQPARALLITASDNT